MYLFVGLMKNKTLALTGSFMNGLDEDLFDWCELRNLSDEESDKVWGSTSEIGILENCTLAEIVYAESPETLLFSDTYYDVFTEDLEQLKVEVRNEIESYL